MRHPLGQVATVLLAVGVTWMARLSEWSWAFSDSEGWAAISKVIVVAAWVNVFAWLSRLWPVVIVCSLLTFVAPWGFIYPGILAGPVLAIAAGFHWVKDDRLRRDLRL